MKTLGIIAVSALSLALGTGFAAKAPTSSVTIGVVNVQEVVQKAPEAKTMDESLHQAFKPRQEKLAKLNKTVLKEHNDLARNSSVMSAKKRKTLEVALLKNQAELRKKAQAYQDDLLVARSKDMHKLFETIKTAVQKVAKADHLNLVVEAHSIAYASDSLDITSQVVKEIK